MKFLPHWRKATWALVIFNVLMLILLVTSVNAAGETTCDPQLSADLCDAARGIGTGIGVTFLVIIWFIGFIVLGLIWLMSRPKDNVTVYGPEGQQINVSEKEAAKRIKNGWTYQR